MIEEKPNKVINTSELKNMINNNDIGIYELTNVIDLLRKGKLEIIDDFNKENNNNLNTNNIENCVTEIEVEDVDKEIEALNKEISQLREYLKGIEDENIISKEVCQKEKEEAVEYLKPLNLNKEIEFIEEINNKVIEDTYELKNKELCCFYDKIILFDKSKNMNFLINHINEYINKEINIIKETLYFREKKYLNFKNEMDPIPEINKYKNKINDLLEMNENKRRLIFEEPLTTKLEGIHDLLQSNYDEKKHLQDFHNKFSQTTELPNYVISENFKRLFKLSRENVLLLTQKYKILELFSIVKEIQTKFKREIFYKLNDERNFFIKEYEDEFEKLLKFAENEINFWEEKMEQETQRKEENENRSLSEGIKETTKNLTEMTDQNEIIIKKYTLLNSKIAALKTEEDDTESELNKYKNEVKEYLEKHKQELSIDEVLFLFKEYEEYKKIFMCTNCKGKEVNTCIKTCMHVFCEECVYGFKGTCKKCNLKFKNKDVGKIYF